VPGDHGRDGWLSSQRQVLYDQSRLPDCPRGSLSRSETPCRELCLWFQFGGSVPLARSDLIVLSLHPADLLLCTFVEKYVYRSVLV
jgi:hypothetical protein